MRQFIIILLFLGLSQVGYGQFGFFSKQSRHTRTASNKASERVVVSHRDAFMRKSKKGPNVRSVNARKRSAFAGKKKKQSSYYGRKTKNKSGGFQARKSNYKSIRKSSGDAFTRNTKKSSGGGRSGGRAGGGRKGKRR